MTSRALSHANLTLIPHMKQKPAKAMNKSSDHTSSLNPANAFVAGLGKLPQTMGEIVALMTPPTTPPRPDMRQRGVIDRFAAVGELEDVYVPTSRDIKLALQISRTLVRGYQVRPPNAHYWLNHTKRALSLAERSPAPRATLMTANTHSVIGTSGLGKSTGIGLALNIFPSVVEHDQEKNPLLPKIQVPTLSVTCPVNRTPKAFITEFFQQIQLKTGINYMQELPKGVSDDALIVEMGRVTSLHCVGLLVFDEVQQVVGGDDRLKDLLVRLTNTLKLPILFVGTFKAQEKLNEELAVARRMLGGPWVPYSHDDEDWFNIIDTLWQYQVTRVATDLDDKLRAKMFELTCGVPALAKALYGFVQEHLIINSDEKDPETITPDLLEQVFHQDMPSVIPAMTALRTGAGLEKFDDLLPKKLPKPGSWKEDDETLQAAVNLAYHDSALKAARNLGRAAALLTVAKGN